MSDHVSQELKDKVQKWLTEEGWTLQEAPAQDFFWAFVASNPSGLKINVAQPNGRSDQFIVRVGCDIHDAQSHLAKLPQKELDEFIWDLRFELLRSEVEFDGLDMPLQRVSISRTIYSDGLSKNSFAETLGKVLRGVMVVIWMLRRKFGDSIPTSKWVQ